MENKHKENVRNKLKNRMTLGKKAIQKTLGTGKENARKRKTDGIWEK